ncbi:C40 family peptidase [Streptomyces albidoflavus]|uniref:C40 family peptidase n=1 Tax=Streptomyces albidoflavus TaxID=1886 RepID=UPI0033F07313
MSGRWRAAATAALAAVALGAAPGAPAAPDPAGGSPAQLLTELQRLHRELGEATETYQATARTLAERRARNKRLGTGLAKARIALAEGRDAAGQLARRQYQGVVEVSPTLRLLLAADAQGALDQEHVLRRAARDRVATVERLTAAERRASGLAREARAALDEEQVLAARQRAQHRAAREKLDEVTALVSSLSPDQLAEVDGLEAERGEEARRDLVAAGGLSSASAVPTRRGERAVRFAVDQIGKPYVWGAEGPDSYDCSGLTQRAWASAGTEVPRTSQEQWAGLDRVPLRALRPGDLVVYFPKATHVALYLGDGLVVHAPRPGADVKVSPVAANPVLGAVRPDPDGTPVPQYEPPALPEGARAGSDTGYAEEAAPGD